ncbi:MAG: hypothetical protein GY715_14675 [Planctomycetes bacterium]|nr:hypothetical protein [Planctomycetota bacterium]
MTTELLAALLLASTPADTGIQVLDLPLGTPTSLQLTVVRDDHPVHLELHRHSMRGEHARVRVYCADGSYTLVEPPSPATYRGVIADQPETAVVAHLRPDGVVATVFPPDGNPWTIRPSGDEPGRHAVGRPIATEPFACGVTTPSAAPPEPHAPAADGPSCQYLCQIAFDADYEYYQLKGSAVPAVVAAIDAQMNEVDFFYARDLNVSYTITDYVVRTAPFYTPTSGGDLLDQFRTEWNTNQAGIVRDIAHLMTDKPGSIIEYGGLAWVGVVCTNSGYGWSRDGANIIGHEVGHNWNAPHCLDPTPCNTMCGACFNIGPVSRQVMLAHRDSRACLDLIGPYPEPLPPYASLDEATVRRHVFEETGPLAFDVLGNDGDGNCDPLVIESHDPVSERGAAVTLSPGSGPDGRDELVYAMPAIPFIGDDTFHHQVGDGTGELSEGTVRVTLRSSALAGYWPLDDVGAEIADATGYGHDGSVVGAPTEATGVIGGAIAFDGVGDAVGIPPLHLDTDEITISAWIRRSGSQPSFAGVVFCRGGSTTAGISCGSANELRYHWNDAAATYGWNSGLVVPDDTWAFVALVVEPDHATMYMHDGTTMLSSVNAVAHGIEAFDAVTHLGWDSTSAARHFGGVIDDVRIHDYALDTAEITSLHAGIGPAEAPIPPDGGKHVTPGGDLIWLAGPGSDAHDVFLATEYVAVRDATIGSPEYRGRTTVARYAPGPLTFGTAYFWRVDEVTDAAVVPGQVWQFTPARVRHWPLDELGGVVVDDVFGDDDGLVFGSPIMGRPSATVALGTSFFLDGVNDRIEIPPLHLHSAKVTLSAWIRRDGPQVDAAGLVFNGPPGSSGGLNLGPDEDLRYHWNGSQWWWESGLDVPDDRWTFIALVVEPDRATLYTGIDGVLTSAVNETPHDIEEFADATHIGQGWPGGRYFRGDVDDTRIYDASLTPAQVETLYLSSGIAAACPDLNGSGVVDFGDVLAAISAWGPCAACPADFNSSGAVDFADLLYIIGRWGEACRG